MERDALIERYAKDFRLRLSKIAEPAGGRGPVAVHSGQTLRSAMGEEGDCGYGRLYLPHLPKHLITPGSAKKRGTGRA